MKSERINLKYLIFGIVLLASNLVFIGVDFSVPTITFDLRFDNLLSNVEELFAVIVYLVVIIACVFIKKNMLLLFVTLSEISEIVKFIFIIKNYDVTSYNYTSNTIIYTLISITLLVVLAYVATLKREHYKLLNKCSIICIAGYAVICALPVLTMDSFINISLFVYYCTLYSIFISFSKKAIV